MILKLSKSLSDWKSQQALIYFNKNYQNQAMYFIFGFSSFIIRWVSEEETRTQRDDSKHFYEQSFVPEQFHFDSVESSWKQRQHTVSRCRKLSLSCVFALRLGNTASLLESAAPTDECKVISAGCGCFVSILLLLLTWDDWYVLL